MLRDMPTTDYFLAGNQSTSEVGLSDFAVLSADDPDDKASFYVETWSIKTAQDVVDSQGNSIEGEFIGDKKTKDVEGRLAPGMLITGKKHTTASAVAASQMSDLETFGKMSSTEKQNLLHAGDLVATFVVTQQVGPNRYTLDKLQRWGVVANKANRVLLTSKQEDDLDGYRIAKHLGCVMHHVTAITLLGYSLHDCAQVPTRAVLKGLGLYPVIINKPGTDTSRDPIPTITQDYTSRQNSLVSGHDTAARNANPEDHLNYVYDDYYVLRMHAQAEGKCKIDSNDDRVDGAFFVIPLSATQALDNRNGGTQVFSMFDFKDGLVTHTFAHGELPMLSQLFFTLRAPNGDNAPCGRMHLWLRITHS